MPHETAAKRILLVDDDLDILIVTKMALEVVGDFITDSCSSAQEALDYLREYRPDLILVDVMMPDLDGISFVKQLKEIPLYSRIPVIFMTARTQTQDIEGYRAAGVLDIISKPFDPEELVIKLNDFLQVLPDQETLTEGEISSKLEQLQELYRERLPGKLREVDLLWSQILCGGENRETVRKLHRLLHNITGAGATFGFKGLSQVAGALEKVLRPMLDADSNFDSDFQGEVTQHLESLKAAAKVAEVMANQASL